MTIKQRLADIQQQIQQIPHPQEVTVIAVTKYASDEVLSEVIDAPILNIAENRVDQLLERQTRYPQATWHLIGTLQTRKVKQVINHIDYFHALDRLSLAKEIQKRANKVIQCFVQVNVSQEATKHGLAVEEVVQFIEEIQKYDRIKVVGLMTMAPHTSNDAVIRQCFATLSALRDHIHQANYSHAPCQYLSMGMSQDYHIAIEEGATHIRLGTTLVGPQ